QYLATWAESQLEEQTLRIGTLGPRVSPADLMTTLRQQLRLDGSGYTYRNFIWYEGYVVMIVLAFAGSLLVGNDFQHGSLPFYLSKPMTRWHYVAGKCLAVGAFVNLMTTLPALGLFAQYGLLSGWLYYYDHWRLLVGILGYGAVLTVVLSLVLMATAVCLRRT